MATFRKLMLVGLLILLGSLSVTVISAQETTTTVLSNNSGDTSAEWFISDEASLVMNGFDLTPLNQQLPAAIDRVSIAVVTPIPGTPVDIVVYQDANGGSPIDAVLIGRAQADISSAGVYTFAFDPAVVVTQPVVWVGFYLPVDFKFQSDVSGTSVLTYWAWSKGTRFDVASLSAAEVLGPANGTSPVNIDMKGIARITAEIRTATEAEVERVQNVGFQVAAVEAAADLRPMWAYPYCSPVSFDTEDVSITQGERVAYFCNVAFDGFAPPTPEGYVRKGFLYEIFAFGDMPSPTKLPSEVTHCITTYPEDLDKAVIGLAQGIPRTWQILTTQRYGDMVCAELFETGFLSYFVPAE